MKITEIIKGLNTNIAILLHMSLLGTARNKPKFNRNYSHPVTLQILELDKYTLLIVNDLYIFISSVNMCKCINTTPSNYNRLSIYLV